MQALSVGRRGTRVLSAIRKRLAEGAGDGLIIFLVCPACLLLFRIQDPWIWRAILLGSVLLGGLYTLCFTFAARLSRRDHETLLLIVLLSFLGGGGGALLKIGEAYFQLDHPLHAIPWSEIAQGFWMATVIFMAGSSIVVMIAGYVVRRRGPPRARG